ncbi:hypothetical protein LSH36_1068g00018 [Paralvinella palmiformis]|uniref:Major facilitator superfamily (MFS) profile domain-containing protein n=1 Tax=Paralvinella palmiformis TaxID=53620 RepID=A0AAD9IVC1_9ANNE|nr:hypothetical protein LSH36_1068g00018 [Paralvinella palmiformis]
MTEDIQMKVNLSLGSSSPGRLWSREERRLWLGTLMAGCATVYATRMVMPLCVVAIGKEQGWSKTDSGSVLSAFFWGYTLTQVMGGYLSDKLGGGRVMTTAAIGWAVITFWTPHLFHWFPGKSSVLTVAIISRVLIGAFQGVHFPSMSSILSRHVPEEQRAFSFAFSACGAHMGSMFAGSIGSLLMERFGWTSPFHLMALERRKNRVLSVHDDLSADIGSNDNTRVPWVTLFTTGAFWALLIGQFCKNTMFFILISWLPTYFVDTYPDAKGWVFNVIPWATGIPATLLSGIIADRLIARGCSTTFIRKLMATVALCGPAFFLLVLSATKTFEGALFCMAAAVGCCGFHSSGILVNPQDIAPRYSGSVFGFMNTAGAIPGFVGVYMAGYILETTHSWNAVFSQTACVCLFGWLIFIIFGTGKKVI